MGSSYYSLASALESLTEREYNPTVLSYNLARKFADFFFKVFVLFYLFAARNGDLNKNNLFTPLWVFVEKDPETLEFLG